MKIIIGSKNPGKIEAVRITFERYFGEAEVIGLECSSNVPEQPLDKQTLDGAKNRIRGAKEIAQKEKLNADFVVAIESGMIELYGNHFIATFAVAEDKNGTLGIGISPCFPVPARYVDDVKTDGLTVVLKKLLGDSKVVPTGHGGITNLTDGHITRIDLGIEALTMATIPHRKDFWK